MIERASPSYTPSRKWGGVSAREAADGRNRWREFLGALAVSLTQIIVRDGERSPVPLDLRHTLATLRRAGFPVDGATAQAMADAFVIQFNALLDASIPRRRVAIAIGVQGSIESLERLIDDQQADGARAWRHRSGGDA
ncbi:hypothetical protein [Caulobacter sp. DWR3-1-2]|uniref:hypothetical protein n=1 Tax=Caulobacter sp. DWR3-1-2 TaxID=2804647 RepID=UPI003CED879B